MYKEEDNIYVFDGDFEEYLLSIGVDHEHIERMKKKKLQPNKDDYYFIDEYDRGEELVPLEKVIGTSRGTVGDSVFDNVRMMRNGVREPSRFWKCFCFLDNMTLEQLKLSYENLSYPVIMMYYEEDDEYYVSLDGNHRTLTAMLIGARYVKAQVYGKHCDFNKKEKYLATIEFYNKYNICQIIQQCSNYYEIIFKEGNECFVVSGFDVREVNKDCYDVIKMLSNEIERDKRKVKLLLKFPVKIRCLIVMFTNNRRVSQYINRYKKTLEVYGRIIYLYDF